MELETQKKELSARGLGLAAITYDRAEVLQDFASRRSITYPLLSDEGSKTIRAFGILNEGAPQGAFFGVPHPGTYVLDAQGRVKQKFFEDDYRERQTAGSMLGLAGVPHETVDKAHATFSAASSNKNVRPNQRITLTLEVEPKKGMHVYAPGATGYIVIEWTLNAGEAARAMDVAFPASEKMKLVGEVVPVYAKPFRLKRDITLAAAAKLRPLLGEGGMLTFPGTVTYQACDDRQCFVPETIDLTWTLKVEGHDSERVPEALRKK